MKREYSVHIVWSKEDEAYVATVPELPGCMADGQTEADALQNVQEVATQWVKIAREEGRPIPEPMSLEDCEAAHAEFRRRMARHIQEQVATAVKHILSETLAEAFAQPTEPWQWKRGSIKVHTNH